MNYFQPYSLAPDETIVAAWDSQVVQAAETPWLAQELATQSADLFPRFAACYAQLRALPRGARRAFQRQLSRSRQLTMVPPEWQQKLAGTLAGAALLLALGQGAALANAITVNTNIPGIQADGLCSLIEAIVNANANAQVSPDCPAGSGADTIELPPMSTITLTSSDNSTYGPTGLPVITSTITIQGNGAKIARSTKKGTPAFRLIAVNVSGDLTLDNVTLSGGTAENGGGVFNSGTLSISNSTISGNTAKVIIMKKGYNVGGYGGGVFNSGTLTITDSTITGNHAYEGGGMFNNAGAATITKSTISTNSAVPVKKHGHSYGGSGAGVLNVFGGDLTVTDSTITGNNANSGGGLFNYSATLTIESSTVTNNSAKFYGGGIYDHGTLTLTRSLISGNTAKKAKKGKEYGDEIYNSAPSVVTANNFNLFGTSGKAGVTGFTPGASDIVPGVSVAISNILAPLATNGGPTQTHALVPGSPAIDAAPVDADCPATDQRGVTRPQGTLCDIGAFER